MAHHSDKVQHKTTGKKPADLNQESPFFREPGVVLPFEAIIMAGGKGERLKPLTDSLPKPLLPVGGKPIVRYTVESLLKTGLKDITFVVNYFGEKIQSEFGDGKKEKASFQYIFEQEPLGTIGGVSLKSNFRYEDILVMNGDLLTTIHFDKFFMFYLDQDADIAVAVIPYRLNLPYGIFEIGDKQEIMSTNEKPTFTYYINTGIYLMKREVLNMIPSNQPCDAIDLIELARKKGLKVSAFPLLDYWIDIGQVEDYQKAQKDIQFLNF